MLRSNVDALVTNLQRQGRNFFIVQGLLALVAGLAIVAWPGPSLAVITVIFAAWIAVDGIFAIISGLRHRAQYRAGQTPIPPTGFNIARGIIQFLFALLIGAAPAIFAALLLFVIAALALIIGFFNLTAAWTIRALDLRNWWVFLITGLVAVAVGVLIIVFPRESIISILWLVGVMAIAQGIAFLIFGFKLNVSLVDGERRESYQRFDGVIQGEVVNDRFSEHRAVDGEIIDDEGDDQRR